MIIPHKMLQHDDSIYILTIGCNETLLSFFEHVITVEMEGLWSLIAAVFMHKTGRQSLNNFGSAAMLYKFVLWNHCCMETVHICCISVT